MTERPDQTAMDERATGAVPDRRVKLVQSVDRALSILELLAGSEQMSLGEIARETGLNPSTTHHLVGTLVARGYVVNAGRGRGYVLSSRMRELTEMADRRQDLGDILRDDLTTLSEALGLGVQLAVMQDAALVTKLKVNTTGLHVVEADEFVKMRAAHATATGKAILAWLPEQAAVKALAETGMEQFTPRTITSISDLMEELRHVRRNGYAVDDEELRKGVICYGAALRDEKGAVVASVSASLPASLGDDEFRDHVRASVVQAARRMSDRLKVSRY